MMVVVDGCMHVYMHCTILPYYKCPPYFPVISPRLFLVFDYIPTTTFVCCCCCCSSALTSCWSIFNDFHTVGDLLVNCTTAAPSQSVAGALPNFQIVMRRIKDDPWSQKMFGLVTQLLKSEACGMN